MSEKQILSDHGMDLLFRSARTYSAWKAGGVSDVTLKALYDLMKYGPTSANCCPARIVFVRTPEAKARLKPLLDAGNVDETMKAPVTAILAYDLDFYESLPKLFPHTNAKSWFEGKEEKIKDTAFRNGTLQGGYFILAARALGLDCGPMSGFNEEAVTREFFPNSRVKANFLCNLGYGEPSSLHPRSPRFDFDDVCQVI